MKRLFAHGLSKLFSILSSSTQPPFAPGTSPSAQLLVSSSMNTKSSSTYLNPYSLSDLHTVITTSLTNIQ
ncbi:hypothetical protein [Winogradskyella bathintestinalis]|uniref:Uncharacterized protein n=1 Tax=Winogradskyella bathintestinalis TaxID=3035208 RepID=A0ABT7ZRM5_9FLAO|nr:hypothetical protein [Winogradskyella bathintestinalis]MDN3491608.1 hypothetical protein [Winogradskyella bathintestinalis]